MPGRYAQVGPWGARPKEMLGPWSVQCLIYLIFSGQDLTMITNILFIGEIGVQITPFPIF